MRPLSRSSVLPWTVLAQLTASALRRRAVPLLGMLIAIVLAAAACGPAPAAGPPFKDAANGGPTDHGWFQGGLVWHGDFPDPHVIRVGSVYYAYSSPTAGRYLPVLTSTDLSTWYIHPMWSNAGPPSRPGYDVTRDLNIPAEIRSDAETPWDKYDNNDALVRTASWGRYEPVNAWLDRTMWAPGVIQIGSTWFAYSAVRVSMTSDDPHGFGRFCLTVATASSPMGPFRDVSGAGPVQCQPTTADPAGSIDPYPYRDPTSGRYYLLWKAAGKIGSHPSSLMSVEIGSDGRPKPGAPWVTLLSTLPGSWEGSTIENPAMVYFGGTTYLFYSGNFFGTTDSAGHSPYATGYAICPHGPTAGCYRPDSLHPLLASNGSETGPGGATAFTDTSGGLRLAYASYWLGENRTGYRPHPRRLHVVHLTQLSNHLLHVD